MTANSKIKELLREAWVKRGEKRYDDAQALVKEAQGLCKKDDYNSLGSIFHVYRQLESDQGNYLKAVELNQESLNYFKKGNNMQGITHAMRHLADLQCQIGKLADAEGNYREVIDIYRDNPSTHAGNLANGLRGFAVLLEKRGKIKESITVWKETKELYSSIHLQEGVDEAKNKIASLSK